MVISKLMKRAAAVVMGAAMVGLGMAAVTEPTSGPATATAPQTQARTLPAGPTVNVGATEWVIFVADMTSRQLNQRDAFDNAMPSFVNDSRREPSGKDGTAVKVASPMGLIRLTPMGQVNTDVAIDVQVTYKTGRVLGHWPTGKPRGGGTSGILWQDVHFATATEQPRKLPADTWLGDLRAEGGGEGGPRMLTCGTVTEPFLLYDLEVAHTVGLQVASGDEGKYKVANITDSPMLDLTFYKKAASGKWRTGTLEKLGKTVALVTPTTAPAPATKRTTRPAAKGQASSMPPTTTKAVASTRQGGGAESQPASAPAIPPAAELAMNAEDLSADAVLAPWRTRLAEAGVTANDQQLILKILANHALDPKRLTAVYRMDSAELDKLLQLEVVPQPRKISRIALVIVRDIDPAVESEISELVKQLGNSAWEKREAAMTELRKIGAKAKPQLEKAIKEKDLEIVYRAEQLLQAFTTPETNQPQN
ncbi:MAG: hypothetical protein FWD61_10925 [Phycisphaerales bacterium]|nr:hypothetical protein [Phycisphaerales bacterium]